MTMNKLGITWSNKYPQWWVNGSEFQGPYKLVDE